MYSPSLRSTPQLVPDLTITTARDEGLFLVCLYGEVDIDNVDLLSDAICDALQAGVTDVVVDLRGLLFIDSTGVHALLAADREMTESGQRLRLLPGPSAVDRVFGMLGVRDQLAFLA